MPFKTSAQFDLKFKKALEYFRSRVPMTDDEFATLDANARRKAFTVAGVAQLDLVSEVQNQLVKSLESGVDFKEFQQAVTAKLEAAWGGPKSGRVETIFRTNIQTAYSAGRYGQMTSPLVLAARPVWVYDAILDSRTSKICGPLAGTTLPADDPWWDTRIPPLHHSCRSSLRSLTQAQADKQGITSSPPEINPASGFGARPDTTQWQPDPSKYEPSIIKGFVRKLLRMPTDLPTNTLLEPNGVPISESLKITKSKRAQATAIRSAIQALDETFADGMLHQASLELTSFARTGGQQGGFDALPRVGTRRILVDQNSPVAGLTALHEVAHRLDFDVLGNKTAFGSESQNPLSSSFQAMRIWRDAVRKSKAIRDLRNLRRQPEADQAHVNYLLQGREVFARSISQFIATQSQNPTLLQELELLRNPENFDFYYTEFWDSDDFKNVTSGIQQMLYNLGWVRTK